MIVVENVIYNGASVSFAAEGVGIHGLLFGNESVKCAWMVLLSGQDEPESGDVLLCRKETREPVITQKRYVGYVPRELALYEDMTVLELLDFIGEAKGVTPDTRAKQIKEAMALTGLAAMASRLVGALTKQNRRRVMFAQALLGNPSVILCDEPFADADREQRRDVEALLRLLGRYKPVVLGSLGTEILPLCTDVTVLVEDGVRFSGAADTLSRDILADLDFDDKGGEQ